MEKIILTDGRVSGKTEPGEKRVAIIILALLGISVVIFTIIHHLFPSIFDVPTLEGIPSSDLASMLIGDIYIIILSWFCFRHAWKRLGLYAATIFLGGSFVFTGLEESMFILLGRWSSLAKPVIMGADGVTMVGNSTYYFTKGFFWFIETPITACFAWFFLAYSCVYMAELLIPRAHIILKAALGGFVAMNMDLWMDPVQTHKAFLGWIWADQPGGLWIFGIPFTNFLGWFMLIFLFALVFDRFPKMVNRLGPGKAALKFYGILFLLELFMLVLMLVYGTIEQVVFSPKLNITLWGIGG